MIELGLVFILLVLSLIFFSLYLLQKRKNKVKTTSKMNFFMLLLSAVLSKEFIFKKIGCFKIEEEKEINSK